MPAPDPTFGPDPLGLAADRTALAAILDAQGRHREALAPLHEALALVRGALGRDHHEVGVLLATLAGVAERAGDAAQAAAHYERALLIQQRLLGPDHPDIAALLTRYGAAVRIGLDQPDP